MSSGIKVAVPKQEVEESTSLVASLDKLKVAKPKSKTSAAPAPAKGIKTTLIFNSNKASNKSQQQDFFKRFIKFICTKETCQKRWESAHGWTVKAQFCEGCGKKGRVTKEQKEANCKMDTFVCRCGYYWDCLHHPLQDELECKKCNAPVQRSGTQQRHAIHVWYEFRVCSVEWEDAGAGRTFSQRCQSCHSAGKMEGTRKETPMQRARRIGMAQEGGFLRGATGTHDVDGCDMCQELSRAGTASNCTRSRHIRVAALEGGDYKFIDMSPKPKN